MALHAHCRMALGALAFSAAASLAEAAPASMERAAGGAHSLVVKVHGTHTTCRYGAYGRGKEGWHRHVSGNTYPCAPEYTTTPPPAYAPTGRGWSPDGPGRPAASPSGPSGASGQKTGPGWVYAPAPKPPKVGPSSPSVMKTSPGQFQNHKKR
jgi:hypothetical protein